MVENKISLDTLLLSEPEQPPKGGCGSCGSGGEGASCGNGLEKIYPTTAVRFGFMRYIGEFTHAPDMKFTCGANVVIQTKRGIEIGEQVSLTCSGCDKSVNRDQMKKWVDACGKDSFIFEAGRILREATAADLAEYSRILEQARERKQFCQTIADRQKLPLKVVECESPFGGERIIFYFRADERVDFRQMVRELASEFRTRIEMRQVGARDEARLLADYETCGQQVCCKTFLKTLKPVSMKMAKMQKATLDPTKVSGRCGRLKCCLRYEHETYEELEAKLPRIGVFVRTAHGDGVVAKRQTLTQLVQIRDAEGAFSTVVIEDVFVVDGEVVPGKEDALRELDEERAAAEEKRRRGTREDRRKQAADRGGEAGDVAGGTADGGKANADAETGSRDKKPRRRRRRSRRSEGDGGNQTDAAKGETAENSEESGAATPPKRRNPRRRRGGGPKGRSGDQGDRAPGSEGGDGPAQDGAGAQGASGGDDGGTSDGKSKRRPRRRGRRRGGGSGRRPEDDDRNPGDGGTNSDPK